MSSHEHRRLAFALPATLFLLLLFVYPAYLMIDLSLRDASIGTVVRGPNPWVGTENYSEVLSSSDYADALVRTGIFLATTVAAQLVLGLALAVVLNERLPGLRISRALVFFVWLLPPVVNGTIWNYILSGSETGATNFVLSELGLSGDPILWLTDGALPMLSIIAVNTWAGAPFVAIVFMAAMQSVPGELYEAARVDGAGTVRRFSSITLPLIRPMIAIVSLLLVIYTFKTFDYIFVLTEGGPGEATTTLPYLAFRRSVAEFDFGEGAAIATTAVALSLVIALPYVLRARKETGLS